MSLLTTLSKAKTLLPSRPIYQVSKAFLNAKRKANKTKYTLEPRRRISAIIANPNWHAKLINGPDYTFQDKRPVPYGTHQYKRICQSREHTAQIIQCNKEIDLALELEKRQLEAEKGHIQSILDRKLKPKGGFIEKK